MEITLSELRANTAAIVDRVDRKAETAVITRHGRAVAVLVPRVQAVASPDELTTDELQAVRRGVAKSRVEIRAGQGIPLEEAKAKLRGKWAKKDGKSARK